MWSPKKRMFLILLVLIGFNPLPGVQFSFGQHQHHHQPPPPPPPQRLLVPMTLVPNASSLGAVCLDGSPPAYHLHPGSGSGVHNWLLQFEGGGWCNDVASCLERSKTRRGSTTLMNKLEVFSGILSNDPAMNPDYYLQAMADLGDLPEDISSVPMLLEDPKPRKASPMQTKKLSDEPQILDSADESSDEGEEGYEEEEGEPLELESPGKRAKGKKRKSSSRHPVAALEDGINGSMVLSKELLELVKESNADLKQWRGCTHLLEKDKAKLQGELKEAHKKIDTAERELVELWSGLCGMDIHLNLGIDSPSLGSQVRVP